MAAPKLRFKEFGSEYNEYNLGKLLKSYRLGGNYSNSEIKTNFPLIKMGNLNRGSINLSKIEYIPSDEIIDDEDRIQLGDLFFNTRNTLDLVGKVAIWRNELPVAYYNSNLMRLEFENNFYMNFLLNTEKSLEKLKAIASGTTSVAAIYTKDLLKVKVKVPFVDEQTKIASFLCAVDEKISQLTQKHALLSQYKQGMMQKLFSQQLRFKADDGSEFGEWEETTIGKITSTISTGATPSTLKEEYWNGNIKWMSSGELNHRHVHDVEKTITELGFKSSSTKILPKHCVLIGLAGQGKTRGTVAINYIELCTNQSIAAIHPNPKVFDYRFIFFNLDMRYQELRALSTGDGGRGGLNLQIIKGVEIHLPCLEEQTKIANFLSSIDQKIEVVAEQIEQAKTWKKGLLQQMFV